MSVYMVSFTYIVCFTKRHMDVHWSAWTIILANGHTFFCTWACTPANGHAWDGVGKSFKDETPAPNQREQETREQRCRSVVNFGGAQWGFLGDGCRVQGQRSYQLRPLWWKVTRQHGSPGEDGRGLIRWREIPCWSTCTWAWNLPHCFRESLSMPTATFPPKF